MNVLLGERYKVIIKEVKDYVKGLYGKPPAPIKEWLIRRVLGDEKPIEGRPTDHLPPILEKIKKELPPGFVEKEEDHLTYALFPDEALEFFKYRKEMKERTIRELKVKVSGKITDTRIGKGKGNQYLVCVQGEALIVDIVEY